MKTCDEIVSDQQVVEKVQRYLTSMFDFKVVVIHKSKDVRAMKIEELQSSPEAHELLVIEIGFERSVQQA